MAFETIDRVGAVKPSLAPADGIRFSTRSAARGSRFIVGEIGKDLSHELVLRGEQTSIALMVGHGTDVGKIACHVDVTTGQFDCKRTKRGSYRFTINAASADGLFTLDFEPFNVAGIPVRPRQGQCPLAVFEGGALLLSED